MVGPGVERQGIDSRTWTDHTNVRPTMLALLGLKDDYVNDGRVLVEALESDALPRALRSHDRTVRELGSVYEQLNAPFGAFARETLESATRAIASSSDLEYTTIEDAIASLTSERDALAATIRSQLSAAAFRDHAIDEHQAGDEIDHAWHLIHRAAALPH